MESNRCALGQHFQLYQSSLRPQYVHIYTPPLLTHIHVHEIIPFYTMSPYLHYEESASPAIKPSAPARSPVVAAPVVHRSRWTIRVARCHSPRLPRGGHILSITVPCPSSLPPFRIQSPAWPSCSTAELGSGRRWLGCGGLMGLG